MFIRKCFIDYNKKDFKGLATISERIKQFCQQCKEIYINTYQFQNQIQNIYKNAISKII